MSSSPSRAHILLLLVVAAGLGVRAAAASHSVAGADGTDGGSVAALDSQLTRVRSAGSAPASRSKRSKKGATPPASASTRAPAMSEGAVRSEQTPFGALPADRLAAEARTPGRKEPVRHVTAGPSSSSIVNLETATAEEIETLPRIGPALARRIVDDRRAHGAFGSLEGLQRVRGVGPALAARLAPRVTFNQAGRP